MRRDAFERRLERLVRENRFTITVVFPFVGATLLIATAESLLPPLFGLYPFLLLFGTLVMRLPLLSGVAPLVDRRAALVLLAVVGYVYGIELVGVATGWPYGEFTYGFTLGPMVGGIPLALPLFFLPLVLNAYLFTLLVLGPLAARRWVRLPVAIAVVLGIDLVLDPGAVALGFWQYVDGGAYYGVPASNFAGWLLSGTVAVSAVDLAFPYERLRERMDDCEIILDDHVSFVFLWGVINAVYGNWIPVALVVVLAGGLLRAARFRRLLDRSDSIESVP
jgi:putative membrane protein